MLDAVRRWLKVQPEEVGVFLWSAALLFMIRTGNVILNNFAETTFLKRFGVEYLPVVYAINAVATFIIMGLLTGIMMRVRSAKLLSYMLVFCGASIALLRLVVGADFTPVYPVLFLLKAQYEALLALVFWNLANDLFNTRQSKRLFPLITIGGVTGGIIGSFCTPTLVRLINLDNLMLVYLVVTVLAALTVRHLDVLFPTLDLAERKATKVKKKRPSLKEEFKKVIPLIKESTLIKILVLITFLPNVLIPILNYQFNFAVNQTFATEGGMVAFFGYFRGVLNIISLVILLFVGKIYTNWGLPVALMFHPANYVIAFLALFFRFDVYSAMYARITTNVLRDTINNPARNILMGILPDSSRALMRPFLRGTVVRIAILLGSGIILLVEGVLHPKYLSLVAVGFAAAWVISSIWLKRAYSGILLDAISGSVIDLKGLEEQDLDHLFQDKRAQNQLIDACRNSQGSACVWYAEMAKAKGVHDLDPLLLDILPQRDSETAQALLALVSPASGRMALDVFEKLAQRGDPELSAALAQAAARLPGQEYKDFLRHLLADSPDAMVQAQALAGLYADEPDRYDKMIEGWLDSPDKQVRCAGIAAAGGSGNRAYSPRLLTMLEGDNDLAVCQHVLTALHALDDPSLKDLVLTRLETNPLAVPLEVIAGLPVDDERTVRALVRLLSSEELDYRELAQDRLRLVPEEQMHVLIESLALPGRRLREALFELLDNLNVSDRDIIAFVRGQLEQAYSRLAESAAADRLPESEDRELLIQHLMDRERERLETILRVLATQADSAEMRIVQRALDSTNERLRSNAVEALDSLIGRSLSATMVPLLEKGDLRETLGVGKKEFGISAHRYQPDELIDHLLQQPDWVGRYLALRVAVGAGISPSSELLQELAAQGHPKVAALARTLAARNDTTPGGETIVMDTESSLTEKILLLKRMEIFDELTVAQLAAIASLTKEEQAAAGQDIVNEGEDGESMYLIVDGEVVVSKSGADGCAMELDRMGPGAYFGEMALVEDMKRSATVTAATPTKLLSLHKAEFIEAVREYPEVALQMCKELSRRLRHVQEKVKTLSVCFT